MNKKIPMRRCAGCGCSKEKNELVRITEKDGKLTIDPSGRAGGRGIYICRGDLNCMALAKKKRAFSRGLHKEFSSEDADALEKSFAEAFAEKAGSGESAKL